MQYATLYSLGPNEEYRIADVKKKDEYENNSTHDKFTL